MQKDQRELLLELNAQHVKFLIVGGYAYSHYAEPRATKDLDVGRPRDLADVAELRAAEAANSLRLQKTSEEIT